MISTMSAAVPSGLATPIVEAVLDIECDMPPALDLGALETQATAAFRDRYPKLRKEFIQEHKIEALAETPPKVSTVRRGLQALQFLQEDEKQLVQIRAGAFSFNRLAPYSRLDEYLPEMERTWRLFVELARPLQVDLIRLRYINRILLPIQEGQTNLDEYLKIGPQLPDEDRLTFLRFLHEHVVLERDTGNQANIILATQPDEKGRLPIILDIAAARVSAALPEDWPVILRTIQSLRDLKNRVFRNTLTEQCLRLFQP